MLLQRLGKYASQLVRICYSRTYPFSYYQEEIKKHETAYNALLEKINLMKARYIDGRRALEGLTVRLLFSNQRIILIRFSLVARRSYERYL